MYEHHVFAKDKYLVAIESKNVSSDCGRYASASAEATAQA